ncbi:Leucine-responsive regulatory protein [Marinomonas spartinae]|uniref:Leucine-responsive regulatory protein n=1 Tax=Marinomonas spartinae TaxID=1792290 RepID=A0A1A8TKI1_9GAMM|nr:Lrp/AsnC family transcriptional regulator [Marinomonas spartinae]MBJ7556005.1 Lrp/AsnC family transcriptional regulator [Marinomonas spartinae]SBS33183.1 Leucine-responsive regulatory protein [Marinomonas spartinae]SBS34872.1 Leucine-responsive regulatory protein [Marinomonas spartinae]
MLDKFDISILAALQKDGRLSNKELAEKIGLSTAPCWRRLKRLEDEGYITNYTAELNAKKVNLHVIAFAQVSMDNHHPETLAPFLTIVRECPEIQECHSVSGDCDFLLKIITKNLDSYDELLSKKLLQAKGVRSVNTMFSMKQPKITREFPLSLFPISEPT